MSGEPFEVFGIWLENEEDAEMLRAHGEGTVTRMVGRWPVVIVPEAGHPAGLRGYASREAVWKIAPRVRDAWPVASARHALIFLRPEEGGARVKIRIVTLDKSNAPGGAA